MTNYFGMVNTKQSSLYTYYAIESFFLYTDFYPSRGDRFYLIDNDNSLLRLPENSNGKIILLKNEIPQSFAYNVNQILKISIKERANLVFLNNDIIFTNYWLPPLIISDDIISLPSCNQYEQYKNDDFILNPEMDLQDYIGREKSFEDIISWRNRNRVDPEYVFLHFHPFYCFRLPFKIASKVGIFDERFGKGGAEDIDYRIRANLLGFKVAIVRNSYVLHFMGKSTWRGGETLEQTEQRNVTYKKVFIKKWGEKLANIFLDPSNAEVEIKKQSLEHEWNEKNYQRIIEKCLQS